MLTKPQAHRLRGLTGRLVLREKALMAYKTDRSLEFDQGEAVRQKLIAQRDEAASKLWAFVRDVTE